jgi:hypothetical protein
MADEQLHVLKKRTAKRKHAAESRGEKEQGKLRRRRQVTIRVGEDPHRSPTRLMPHCYLLVRIE